MIGSLDIGGSQSFVMNIYRKIDRSKVQFDFIIDHPENDYYASEIEEMGGKVFRFKTFTGRNYFSMVNEWKNFFSTHPEYKVLHCHVRSYASLFIPIAKKYGVKVIIHSHSDSNGRGFKAIFKYILQLPLRYQADYYMACSEKAGKWLFGKKIYYSSKFSIAKNAIDTDKFLFSKGSRNKIRKQYGIENNFVLGFVARVTEAKNPLFVIDVMKELLTFNEKSILLFVGDGDLLENVKQRVKQQNIVDKVIFTGAQSNVYEFFSAMDYYILPSRWEGLGISLIEAQASGIKCVCSSAIPSEAIIIEENIKVLSLDKSPKEWAKDIANTKLDDRTYSKNILDRIKLKGYDISDNAKYFYDFYLKLFSEGTNKNK